MQKNTIRKLLDIPQFKITEIISNTKEAIHIRLESHKRRPAICSGCGSSHHKGYHGSIEVTVEDRALCEKRTYLHVTKKRYRCSVDGRIYVESIIWLKTRSRFTKRFGVQVYRLTAITTNQEAGWFLGLDDEVIYRIDKEILEEKEKTLLKPIPAGVNLSVDEVSYRKYHKYLTNVIDTDRRLVIWNENGRKAEILDKYYEGIGVENCQKIESVAMDGARTYISSTTKHAVNALIVYDKFHIMQKLNNTVDEVRKDELLKARKNGNQEIIDMTNSRQRFILLKRKENLTEKQSAYLKILCEINEPIYKAMLLKESFQSIYSYHTVEEAEKTLKEWIEQAAGSELKSFQELSKSFTDKMSYILNWFKKKISSSISEGFNNKIKRLKRMAYGYRDIDYFRLKIHQHCGLLNPRLAT